nr:glycoside hydrolase family protein [Candidatus Liberibacter sp.]
MNQVFKISPILISCGESRISAIGDFVFNFGIGAYRNSTLCKCVDIQDWEEALIEIRKWAFAGEKQLKDLVARRETEAELLLKD